MNPIQEQLKANLKNLSILRDSYEIGVINIPFIANDLSRFPPSNQQGIAGYILVEINNHSKAVFIESPSVSQPVGGERYNILSLLTALGREVLTFNGVSGLDKPSWKEYDLDSQQELPILVNPSMLLNMFSQMPLPVIHEAICAQDRFCAEANNQLVDFLKLVDLECQRTTNECRKGFASNLKRLKRDIDQVFSEIPEELRTSSLPNLKSEDIPF